MQHLTETQILIALRGLELKGLISTRDGITYTITEKGKACAALLQDKALASKFEARS